MDARREGLPLREGSGHDSARLRLPAQHVQQSVQLLSPHYGPCPPLPLCHSVRRKRRRGSAQTPMRACRRCCRSCRQSARTAPGWRCVLCMLWGRPGCAGCS